jgi:superfamily II DNA or RNA helicase
MSVRAVLQGTDMHDETAGASTATVPQRPSRLAHPTQDEAVRLQFDRGTLLVDPGGSGLDVRTLPGVLWDERVGTFRAPGYRLASIRRELERRHIASRCFAAPSTPAFRGPLGSWGPLPLRPYQQAALDAWTRQDRRGTVVLPTGSGKTRVALAAMAAVGCPALCLVPTRVLLHQWIDALEQVYGGPVGQLGDGLRELQPVTVATYESAWRRADRIGDAFGLLVIDEVHHFGQRVHDEALEMCVAPLRLGLTATPPQQQLASERLQDLVGPVVMRCSVDQLAGQWLCTYRHITLQVELDEAERRLYERERATFRSVYRSFRKTFPQSEWTDFVRTAQGSESGRRALAGWRRARTLLAFPRAKADALQQLLTQHRDARVLVFTADNATAYRITRRHLVMPITCEIRRDERDDALEAFRRGELRVLVSSRVLNEGIDVPAADVAIVVGGALGAREHVQRVGRLLRPAPGKRALVYELVVRASVEERQAHRRRRGLQ